ncbi:MAG TPA: tRNA (adenosine(37)-N6)-threonylcarbamoyltransferase complex dimerization subunit type 1 TsaB [Nitrospiraceae bacterium]|nr:tRNA (adenosine(37)-N6)-threonylcarbamoyltransferase complex dimerization subunit type 1 TsaB [Nitrospiraceae bacterium]
MLAIETATTSLSVAVLEDERVLAQSHQPAPGQHAKYLVPAIDQILQSSELTLAALDGLAVSIGPGSFTGLRVGLATAMGFRMATGLPLAAVPSLEAMAWNLRGMKERLCPVFKARTEEVYWSVYQWTASGELKRLAEERVGSLEMMVESLHESTIVFGEGWETNKKAFQKLLEQDKRPIQEAPPDVHRASAVSVGLAGHRCLLRGEVAGLGLSPRYVQRAEAELMRERRASR